MVLPTPVHPVEGNALPDANRCHWSDEHDVPCNDAHSAECLAPPVEEPSMAPYKQAALSNGPDDIFLLSNMLLFHT